MTDTKDLSLRLEKLETTIAEAKGTLKAGIVFIGVLNGLLLPLILWLFSSMAMSIKENAVQDVKIEKLESSLARR